MGAALTSSLTLQGDVRRGHGNIYPSGSSTRRLDKVPDKVWNQFTKFGGEALSDAAPHTEAFKKWALKSLNKVIKALEIGDSADPRLNFTVGLDANYAEKEFRSAPKQTTALDTTRNKGEQYKDMIPVNDPRPIPACVS